MRSIEKGKALLPEACELVQGDITDPAAVRHAMEGCSVDYHAAGIPEQWLPDPARFHLVNVCGTQNALDAALAFGVRSFILAHWIAGIGEWVAKFTHRPPLFPEGGLYFLEWQAIPKSEKAQRELGWKPTPLRDGLRQTIAFLNRQSSGSYAVSG